jgi:integrase
MDGNRFNFTNKSVDQISPPDEGRITYSDSQNRYLKLRVTKSGTKLFYYARRINGKLTWLKLGNFPEMNVAQARQKCADIGSDVSAGLDPSDHNRKIRDSLTFGGLFDLFLEIHSKPHKKSCWFDEMCLRCYLSDWKAKRVKDISPDFVSRWHIKLGEKSGKIQANRTLQLVRSVFNFGIKQQYFDGRNPCASVKRYPEKSRDRFLNADEIKRFFQALETTPTPDMKDFFLLALYTGARRGNVQSMKWNDLDLKQGLWIIQAEESKNSDPMKVILTPEAVEILQNRKATVSESEYVFPSKRSDSDTKHLVEPKKAWKSVCESAGLKDLHIHDLRRTLGSWQAAAGSSLHIIGKSLGHKNQSTTAIYARLDIDPVRRSVEGAVAMMRKSIDSIDPDNLI